MAYYGQILYTILLFFFIECETKTPFRVEFIWLDSTRVNVTLIVYMFVIHV